MRQEVIERHGHATGHPLLPQRLQAAGRDLPGLMRLGHARHEQRERHVVAGHVGAAVASGHDLRSLHAPPGHHHPGSRRLHHHGLDLGIRRMRLGREPARRTEGLEHLEPEIHLASRRRPLPRLGVVAVDPRIRREEDAPGPGRHRGERRQRQALGIDREPLPAHAGDRGGLPRRPRIDLRGELGEQRRAGPRESRPLAEPPQVVDEFEARAEHRAAGHEQIDVPRQRPHARIGRSDQGPPLAHVAGPHPPRPFGERLEIARREAAAHVPHQHAIPIAQDGHRFEVTDIDVGDLRRRADHPQPRPPCLGKQVAAGRCRQPHAVEAERSDRVERLTVVVERPRKERQTIDLDHASGDARRRIDRGD